MRVLFHQRQLPIVRRTGNCNRKYYTVKTKTRTSVYLLDAIGQRSYWDSSVFFRIIILSPQPLQLLAVSLLLLFIELSFSRLSSGIFFATGKFHMVRLRLVSGRPFRIDEWLRAHRTQNQKWHQPRMVNASHADN